MMKGLFHSMASLAMVLFGLSATAQTAEQATTQVVGKEGTVIRFDKSTATSLYASGAHAEDSTTQYFGLMKHDISPVYLFMSNKGEMDTEHDNGLFTDVANGFLFDKASTKFYLTNSSSYPSPYIAIVAPKGFRFLRYEWNIDGANCASGLKLQQVTYDSDYKETLVGDEFVIDNTKDNLWSEVLANGSNILYFKITSSNVVGAFWVNSLKLTYAIDQPFSGQLPAADESTKIKTGVLDLGKFSNNNLGAGYWSFDKDSTIRDDKPVNIYHEAIKVNPDVVSIGEGLYYVAAANGDYHVEAPEKFRVVGATLNFLRNKNKKEVVASTVSSSSFESGEYVLGTNSPDDNGVTYYLNLNSSGEIEAGTNAETATKWTITKTESGYTIKSGEHYLSVTGTFWSRTLSISSTSYEEWKYGDNGFYVTVDFVVTSNYYLRHNTNSWEVSTTNNSNQAFAKTVTVINHDNASNFVAKVFSRDDQTGQEKELLEENDEVVSVELNDFNNDAVHFSIKGLEEGKTALYNVNLRLLPLNPELQNLSVRSKFGNDESVGIITSVDCENYDFNNGKAMTIVVPENINEEECTIEFLNAENEEATRWYKEGINENNTASTGGYSNYFLVCSKADVGGDSEVTLNLENTDNSGARTSATMAGTIGLPFTNIKSIYKGGDEYLVENEFKKEEAMYSTAKVPVEGDSAQFFLYTADQPTFQIMPEGAGSKHIDFRYFTLWVQCKKQVENAVADIIPIYRETLKSANHKNPSIASDGGRIDNTHTFYGVKVKAIKASNAGEDEEVLGYLTSESIVQAIKDALELRNDNYCGFGEDDPFRGMLYLDISELNRTDDTFLGADFIKSTADNFLFFAPGNFTPANTTSGNVINKRDDGFMSGSSVVLYDQQPFFTPYDFNTGQYGVVYEREGTTSVNGSSKAKVKNMTAVLPFDVNLDGEGHMKLASDVVDKNVTYYNITSSGEVKGDPEQDLTYAVTADSLVGETVAKANEPYYIVTKQEGFVYNILDAHFCKTGVVSSAGEVTPDGLKRTNGTWTAIGSYSGVQPTKNAQRWYFSKEFFWKSEALKANDHFNIRPFRAYFETTDQTAATKAMVVFGDRDIVSTGIGSVASTASSLQVATGHGFISLTAGSATQVAVYTVAGQLVANASLADGETRRVSLPQGVYMVNQVKVVVK